MTIDAMRGQVSHLILAATGWDERPRRVLVSGRAITIDYFGSQPATLLTAVCVGSRVDLLVIPPAAGTRTAHTAMVRAMSTGNRVIAARTPVSPGAGHTARQAVLEEEIGAPHHDSSVLAVASDSSRLG